MTKDDVKRWFRFVVVMFMIFAFIDLISAAGAFATGNWFFGFAYLVVSFIFLFEARRGSRICKILFPPPKQPQPEEVSNVKPD